MAGVKVPPLLPCPGCGIHIQKGRGPHGLAFHECKSADLMWRDLEGRRLTPEVVLEVVLKKLTNDVISGKVSTDKAIAALAGLHKAKNPRQPGRPKKQENEGASGAGGGSESEKLVAFLTGR